MKHLHRWFNPSALPIAVKLSAVILVSALLPMSITATYNLRRSLTSVKTTEYRNLELLANVTASRLDQLISDTQRVVRLVSKDRDVVNFLLAPPKIRDTYRQEVEEILENVKSSNPDYGNVFLLDRTGLSIASTNRESLNRRYNFRNYFQQAIQGKSYISDILTGTTIKEPGLYFSMPVIAKNNQIIGVAIIKLEGQVIWEIVDSLQVGSNGYAFLVDEHGIIVAHPNKSLLYHTLVPFSSEDIQKSGFANRFSSIGIFIPQSANLPELAKVILGAKKLGHTSYQFSGEKSRQIVGFAPLKKKPWVVVVNESEEEFAAPLNFLAQQTYLSVLAVGGMVIILALLLAKTIVKPIQELTAAAKYLEKGNFTQARVKVHSTDEIGILANTFNTMADGLRDRERERDIFGRVVSPAIRERLLTGELQLGGETLSCTVLFSDIRGFSTISEQISAQQVVAILNEYFTEMSDAIRPWGGYINNFIGDAIVVLFGAPINQEEKEWRAVAAALTMRDRLHELNQRRIARGEITINTGIGISTGEVVAGQVGSLERLLYTVIGDAVNIAARLESLTKEYPEYPILINGATAEIIKERQDIVVENLGLMKVKGRVEPVEVYAVVNWQKPTQE